GWAGGGRRATGRGGRPGRVGAITPPYASRTRGAVRTSRPTPPPYPLVVASNPRLKPWKNRPSPLLIAQAASQPATAPAAKSPARTPQTRAGLAGAAVSCSSPCPPEGRAERGAA